MVGEYMLRPLDEHLTKNSSALRLPDDIVFLSRLSKSARSSMRFHLQPSFLQHLEESLFNATLEPATLLAILRIYEKAAAASGFLQRVLSSLEDADADELITNYRDVDLVMSLALVHRQQFSAQLNESLTAAVMRNFLRLLESRNEEQGRLPIMGSALESRNEEQGRLPIMGSATSCREGSTPTSSCREQGGEAAVVTDEFDLDHVVTLAERMQRELLQDSVLEMVVASPPPTSGFKAIFSTEVLPALERRIVGEVEEARISFSSSRLNLKPTVTDLGAMVRFLVLLGENDAKVSAATAAVFVRFVGKAIAEDDGSAKESFREALESLYSSNGGLEVFLTRTMRALHKHVFSGSDEFVRVRPAPLTRKKLSKAGEAKHEGDLPESRRGVSFSTADERDEAQQQGGKTPSRIITAKNLQQEKRAYNWLETQLRTFSKECDSTASVRLFTEVSLFRRPKDDLGNWVDAHLNHGIVIGTSTSTTSAPDLHAPITKKSKTSTLAAGASGIMLGKMKPTVALAPTRETTFSSQAEGRATGQEVLLGKHHQQYLSDREVHDLLCALCWTSDADRSAFLQSLFVKLKKRVELSVDSDESGLLVESVLPLLGFGEAESTLLKNSSPTSKDLKLESTRTRPRTGEQNSTTSDSQRENKDPSKDLEVESTRTQHQAEDALSNAESFTGLDEEKAALSTDPEESKAGATAIPNKAENNFFTTSDSQQAEDRVEKPLTTTTSTSTALTSALEASASPALKTTVLDPLSPAVDFQLKQKLLSCLRSLQEDQKSKAEGFLSSSSFEIVGDEGVVPHPRRIISLGRSSSTKDTVVEVATGLVEESKENHEPQEKVKTVTTTQEGEHGNKLEASHHVVVVTGEGGDDIIVSNVATKPKNTTTNYIQLLLHHELQESSRKPSSAASPAPATPRSIFLELGEESDFNNPWACARRRVWVDDRYGIDAEVYLVPTEVISSLEDGAELGAHLLKECPSLQQRLGKPLALEREQPLVGSLERAGVEDSADCSSLDSSSLPPQEHQDSATSCASANDSNVGGDEVVQDKISACTPTTPTPDEEVDVHGEIIAMLESHAELITEAYPELLTKLEDATAVGDEVQLSNMLNDLRRIVDIRDHMDSSSKSGGVLEPMILGSEEQEPRPQDESEEHAQERKLFEGSDTTREQIVDSASHDNIFSGGSNMGAHQMTHDQASEQGRDVVLEDRRAKDDPQEQSESESVQTEIATILESHVELVTSHPMLITRLEEALPIGDEAQMKEILVEMKKITAAQHVVAHDARTTTSMSCTRELAAGARGKVIDPAITALGDAIPEVVGAQAQSSTSSGSSLSASSITSRRVLSPSSIINNTRSNTTTTTTTASTSATATASLPTSMTKDFTPAPIEDILSAEKARERKARRLAAEKLQVDTEVEREFFLPEGYSTPSTSSASRSLWDRTKNAAAKINDAFFGSSSSTLRASKNDSSLKTKKLQCPLPLDEKVQVKSRSRFRKMMSNYVTGGPHGG
ncbi:unnamed protein product [Amoebophrya sp. A25]|nr:unnamed protein product [Amoebophrya sp. A25]|eukprot:GSA25T00022046001.1